MNKSLGENPIIKVFVVVLLGTLAFRLLFNILTGGGMMDHMGQMDNYRYGGSFDGFLGGLLVLLVKLLMVVLVIAVVVGVFMWIKNAFFKNAGTQNPNTSASSSKLLQSINNDPVTRTILIVTAAILAILLIFSLLGGFMGTGFGGYGGMTGSRDGGMYGAFSPGLSIGGLLNLLVKALVFILVISLIAALFAYIKKQYDTGAFSFSKAGTQGNPNNQSNQDNQGNQAGSQ